MTSRDFCYWLQGFFELNEDPAAELSAKQVEMIRRHLAMVFLHEIDPAMGGPAHQAKLSEAHEVGPVTTATSGSGWLNPGKRPDGTIPRC